MIRRAGLLMLAMVLMAFHIGPAARFRTVDVVLHNVAVIDGTA